MIMRVGEAPLAGECSRPKNVGRPTDNMVLLPSRRGDEAPLACWRCHRIPIFAAAAGIYSRDRGTEFAAALFTGDAE
jgi:hypothetical protein